MDNREIAAYLINLTDEEFAETFVLMKKMWKEERDDVALEKKDMLEFDIASFVRWLESVLDEIIFSEEIDASAWWKN